jgi:ribose 5-phosphate isomerase B
MKIAIGCDEAAYKLKLEIKDHLKGIHGVSLVDEGCNEGETVLYPDIALKVGKLVSQGKVDRGILMCGTGIGMSISANKIPGIRAAVCHDPYSAERARKSNDAQILCMGARVIGTELAKYIVDIWLHSEFAGGRSLPKVNRISEIEREYLSKMGDINERNCK